MAAATMTTNPVLTKMLAIRAEMAFEFVERDEEILGLLMGLVARQHVLFLGPPGTGKSALTRDLCSRIQSARYFEKLMARTTTPDELFGPPSLKGLENDEYRRVTTGKLLEAHVGFLDEVWKANSAVLNDLLGVLNERQYENGGQMMQLPLEVAVGASNEMPEDETLNALWDRFLLRYMVKYIRDPKNFEIMLSGRRAASRTMITPQELAIAQKEAAQVDVAKIMPLFFRLNQQLRSKSIPVSDRRWKQVLGLIKAHAWINGRTAAQDDDLEALVPALWTEPSQIPEIRVAIMSMANPMDQKALLKRDEGLQIYSDTMKFIADADGEEDPNKKATLMAQVAKKGFDAIGKFSVITAELNKLKGEAERAGKSPDRIDAALADVENWNGEVMAKCLQGKR